MDICAIRVIKVVKRAFGPVGLIESTRAEKPLENCWTQCSSQKPDSKTCTNHHNDINPINPIIPEPCFSGGSTDRPSAHFGLFAFFRSFHSLFVYLFEKRNRKKKHCR